MKKLEAVKAGVVGCGDLLGVLSDDGQMVFRRVEGAYALPDELNKNDRYVPSPDVEIKIENGPRIRYSKKDRVIVGVRW